MLVGSVAGQRYWSTLLPAADSQEMITCGTWTPDDQQVYLGTSQVRLHKLVYLLLNKESNIQQVKDNHSTPYENAYL